jgi:large subunit ribosomal protein L22
MEVRALGKHVPMSARKVRRVIDQVRNMDVESALEMSCAFMPHAGARPVEKLVRSALANAEENIGLSRDNLYIAGSQLTTGRA